MEQATERILGIEGGGTKTSWMLFTASGGELQLLNEGQLAPANFRLTNRERILEIWREMPRAVERVGAFLAGCGTPADRADLAKLCAEVWPTAAIVTGSDRESGFSAAFGEDDGIAVNAGTGSSITGRRHGRVEQAGGWGHVLGDAGGGYYLSLQTLRFVLRDYDLHRRGSDLAKEVLRALCLNDLNELVRWAQTAGKMEIATLAPLVFAAGTGGHERVNQILRSGAHVLGGIHRRGRGAAGGLRSIGGAARRIVSRTFHLCGGLPAGVGGIAAGGPRLRGGKTFGVRRRLARARPKARAGTARGKAATRNRSSGDGTSQRSIAGA
jgi:N-acetylglucosamine kinase-like BadF-type ATPase